MSQNWFPGGMFSIDPGATPEQIARKRAAVQAMFAPRTIRYAGEGLADGVAAALAGFQGRKLDKFEGEKRSEASEAFQGMLGSTPPPQGPMTVLGMDPAWGGAASLADPQAVEQAPFTITPGGASGSSIDQSYFDSIRAAESGGDWTAKNPRSSARGGYQFIDSTWDELRRSRPDLGLTADGRGDPAQEERAIRAFTEGNAQRLASAGLPVDNGTLYAAHFLGAGV